MATIIEVTDLPSSIQSNELVAMMVLGANATASRVAPCLASSDPTPSSDQINEAKLVLIGAVKRWADAGSGAFQQQAAGPFSVSTDTRQRTGFNLWPSEIERLQDICGGKDAGKAWSIDTAPGVGTIHSPVCSIHFGANYCSCGADIAGFALFEPDEV